jgi:hypothetical protein
MVSTLAHNPGDEIIRLGLDHVMRRVFPGAKLQPIHKHDPRTLFPEFKQRAHTPRRLISPHLYSLYAATKGRSQKNYLDEADLVVFAGTPFIWRGDASLFRFTSANAEWVPSTWQRLFGELRDKPVVNLAAGTSVTNQGQIDAILADPSVKGFLKQAVERASVTTARDIQTKEIFGALGYEIPIIPCSSILAAQGAYLTAQPPEYVVLNVMRSAAHSWRGQRGDSSKWHDTISAVLPEIEKRMPIIFVSHSKDDDQAVAEWFPNHQRFFSLDPVELLKVYSKARYGICNRVHSGGAIASFARPAVVVGGDSRIDLIRQFGLPTIDHREVDGPGLLAMVDKLEQNYDSYVEKLRGVIRSTERAYVDAVSALQLDASQVPAAAGRA